MRWKSGHLEPRGFPEGNKAIERWNRQGWRRAGMDVDKDGRGQGWMGAGMDVDKDGQGQGWTGTLMDRVRDG